MTSPQTFVLQEGRAADILNEASWARVGNFVARHAEPASLHGARDLGLRLPFTPPG